MTQNPFSRFPPEPGPVVRPVHPGVPDPGTPGMAWLAGLIAVVCFATVVYLNQVSTASSSTQKAAKAVSTQQAIDLADPVTLAMKMVVKLAHLFDNGDQTSRAQWLAQAQSPVTDPAKRSEVERVREAIVHAEILKGEDGAKEADRLFDAMESEFADRPDRLARKLEEDEQERIEQAKQDIATLRQVYSLGGAGDAAPLTEEQRQRLIQRHDWFAKVAFTFGKPESDPERAALLSGGGALIAGILLIVVAGLVAAMGGMGCSIAMVVLIATGKIRRRFVAPAPGGSFGWELLAAFLVAFLGFRVAATILGAVLAGTGSPPAWYAYVALGGQWLVALSIFFPLLRGVKFGEYRKLVGWTAERGIFREIGAGIFGYLAGLPIVFGALLFSLLLNFLIHWWSGKDAETPENPILEIAGRGDTILLVLLFTLATIWAPIVEETVFRGGVFRAMRAHVGFVVAAIASALVFGFMHGYQVQLLGPVIAIGLVFALIREWRGSIIGPMVAHFLNNATILGILFLVLTAAA
ncbi:MAG: CPBP family intramembrane metalloprotease [Phycisphaeraceae bacterium]|nr:CPBP family intramembrane metalloprotease [Phycisphaeraceae bacterium]